MTAATPTEAVDGANSATVRHEIWLVALDPASGVPAALERVETITPRLAADECSWAAQGTDGARRMTRLALRLLLERFLSPDQIAKFRQQPLPREAAGRPIMPLGLPSVTFSLSHTASAALIAIAEHGPIGIDVEAPREIRMAPRRRAQLICAGARAVAGGRPHEAPPDTASDLATFDVLALNDQATLTAWTRLEALGKALGTGVASVLADHGVLARAAGAPDPQAGAGKSRASSSSLSDTNVAGRDPTASDGPRPECRNATRIAVHDLDLPAGLTGAIALTAGLRPARLRHLPPTADRIAALAAEHI